MNALSPDLADNVMLALVTACAVPGLLGIVILMTEPTGKALAFGNSLLRFMFGSVFVAIVPLYLAYSAAIDVTAENVTGTVVKLALAVTVFVPAYYVFTRPPKKKGTK